MSAFYDRLEATARRLIKDKGFVAVIVRPGAPTGPAHDPQPGVPTRHDCQMVETRYSMTNRDETLVQRGDKLGLISTETDVVPALPDRIEIGGEQYAFLDVQPLAPGRQTLIYKFHARK